MRWLSDATLEHLRRVADWPDLQGTRYQIIQPIGSGGMGDVFLAEDRELKRQVAIKILKDPELDSQAANRMLKEAQIIAQLEHPGIVPLHDMGRLPDGRVYYVMKLVRGKRLDEHFDGDATVTDRLRIFERICETVAFAHDRGVLHRDLKPQNIMVGAFGEVLVLDWGVAKILGPGLQNVGLSNSKGADPETPIDEGQTGRRAMDVPASHPATRNPLKNTDSSETAQGTIIGTPAYMAPEQARGEISRIGPRSDIYSLGAILEFLVAGGGHAAPTLRPSKRASAIPRALRAICGKAMAVNDLDRYPNVTSLAADIGSFLAGQPVSAYQERLDERLRRVAWNYRTAILLIAAYLAMRILLLFWLGR